MNETFAVGEIAITQNCHSDYIGRECVIVALPQAHIHRFEGAWALPDHYVIRFNDEVCIAPPHCLRKKRPPEQNREQLGEWELCPWRPATTPVTERA